VPVPLAPPVDQFGLFFLVLARAGGLFAVAPLLAESGAVPMPLRALLSFLVALAVMPAVAAPAGGVPPDLLPYAALVVHEVAIGLVVGLVARVVFLAAELAGTYCDVQLGLTMASLVDPVYGEPVAILGSWLGTVGTLAFVAGGGLEALVAALALSYRHLPVGAPVLVSGGAATALAALGWAFVTGLAIAAPVLALGLLLNLLLGVLSRAMPQLNALQSVMPAQVLVGILVLLLATPAMIVAFGDLVPQTLDWVGRLWS
jgi:flagellar biosynthetic protein FliR